MTFEEILPGLKAKKKYVRTGWGGAENYVQLFDTIEQNGVALEVTPYFHMIWHLFILAASTLQYIAIVYYM